MNEPIDQPVADLMTIGRFSQLSRLSLKALRLYDALELLPPAFFDPASSLLTAKRLPASRRGR